MHREISATATLQQRIIKEYPPQYIGGMIILTQYLIHTWHVNQIYPRPSLFRLLE